MSQDSVPLNRDFTLDRDSLNRGFTVPFLFFDVDYFAVFLPEDGRGRWPFRRGAFESGRTAFGSPRRFRLKTKFVLENWNRKKEKENDKFDEGFLLSYFFALFSFSQWSQSYRTRIIRPRAPLKVVKNPIFAAENSFFFLFCWLLKAISLRDDYHIHLQYCHRRSAWHDPKGEIVFRDGQKNRGRSPVRDGRRRRRR